MTKAGKILESLKSRRVFSEASIPSDVESKLKDELYKVFRAGTKSSIEVTGFGGSSEKPDFIDVAITYPDGDVFGNTVILDLSLNFRQNRLKLKYKTKFDKSSLFDSLIMSNSDTIERKFVASENYLEGLGEAIKTALK